MGLPSRRRVLAVLGTGTVGGLAGCSADRSDATDTATEPPTSSTTRGSTTTKPPGDGTTDGDETGDGDDEAGDDEVTEEERVAIAKAVAAELAAGEFETVQDRFADPYADEVSPDAISQVWRTYADPLGAYRGATVAEQASRQGFPTVALRLAFERGVLRLELAFEDDALAGLWIRPPEASYERPAYADVSSVAERSLTVPSTACDLGATLTLPADAGADATVPGVVLVHGTGPSDRDQTIGPNKPFKDLALGLASNGIAVLRYDKRTHTCGVSRRDGLDLDDLTVDDAVVAIDTLRAQPAIDDVAVVGHSQGGYAAPRIAARADPFAMVGLAAPAGSLADLVAHQVRYTADLDAEITATERERIDEVEATVDRIHAGEFGDDEMLLAFHANFWRDVGDYDPPAAAAALDVPRFLAFGGRDWQVPVDRARPAWTDDLGDDPAVRMETYADANHLLIPGEGTPTPGEYVQQGNVTADLVTDLASWLQDVH